MSRANDLVPFAPVSPSEYWKIRTWQYEAIAKRHGPSVQGLHITFEHVPENGNAIRVEVYVDRAQSLDTLLPFLDAARGLPAGFRIEAHVLESAPWDIMKAPRRFEIQFPDIDQEIDDIESGK